MDGDREVHPVLQREGDRVGDHGLARVHRHGRMAVERELDGRRLVDLRGRAHRLGHGDFHAQDVRRIRVEQVRQVQPEGFSADGHLHDLPEGVPGEAGLRRTVVRFGDLQGRGPGGDPVARLRESGGQARREGEHEQESFHRWGGLLGKRLGLTMIGSPASSCCGMPSRSDWMLRKRSESMGVRSGSTPAGSGRPEKVWK